MKNIINKKTMLKAILILGGVLISASVLAVPGSRTYIGTESANSPQISDSISEQQGLMDANIDNEQQIEYTEIQNNFNKESIELASKSTDTVPVDIAGSNEQKIDESSTPASLEINKDTIIQSEPNKEIKIVSHDTENTKQTNGSIMTNNDIVKYYEQNTEYFKKQGGNHEK